MDKSHLIYTLEAAPLPSEYVPNCSFLHVNVLQVILILQQEGGPGQDRRMDVRGMASLRRMGRLWCVNACFAR